MQTQQTSDGRWLWTYPTTLSTSETEGSFVIKVPRVATNIAVLNNSGAQLAYASGQLAAQPPDAVIVEPNYNLALPIEETDTVTVFWSSSAQLANGQNQVQVMFSNLTIQVSGGPTSSGGVANAVTVTNTPNVNVNTLPAVNVSTMPSFQGSDYGSPAANHTVKVDADGNLYAQVTELPAVTIANSTLATAGIVGTAQTEVGTSAVELTVFSGCRNFEITNTDPTNTLYLGSSNAVTVSTGYPIPPKSSFGFDVDPTASDLVIWAVASETLEVATIGVK